MKIIDERHLFDVKIGDAQFYVLGLTIVAAMNEVSMHYLEPLDDQESIEFTARIVPDEVVDKIPLADRHYKRLVDYIKGEIAISDNPNILTSTEW